MLHKSAKMLPFLPLSCIFHYALARQVNISVDASNIIGDLPPVTRFFGADEPNEAVYPDGTALINDLGELLGPHQTYFRTHNLLTTCDPPGNTQPNRLKWGCTNAYTEDSDGNPIYDWTIVDEIFDTYLENNVKPYAQVSFTPKALSTHPEPYTFYFDPEADYESIYVGWSYPPTSYKKYGELVYQWVKHCVERYGKVEVESWYWEVSISVILLDLGCLTCANLKSRSGTSQTFHTGTGPRSNTSSFTITRSMVSFGRCQLRQ